MPDKKAKGPAPAKKGPGVAPDKKAKDPFYELLGKALVDAGYRAMLLDPDPAQHVAALKLVGIANPTKQQVQALENSIGTLRTLYGTFGDGVGAA